MDEFEELRNFRANLRGPDASDVATTKDELMGAFSEERSRSSSSGGGPLRMRKRLSRGGKQALALSGTAAAVALALVVGLGNESNQDQSGSPKPASLSAVASGIQRTSHLDFEHLSDLGVTLSDISQESTVVGIGRIEDVRLGYQEADGVDHMYLVIKPDKLAKGANLLGTSGRVLVDEIAPQVNNEGVRPGFDNLRQAAINAPERVAFMLSPTPASWYTKSPDPYAGRSTDDPVFIPTHPSSLLAINDGADVAFPLATDEDLAEVRGNTAALKALGATVDRFTAGSSSVSAAEH